MTIKTIDKDGLLLCDLQARAFEKTCNDYPTSSEVFIRRFMNSDISKMLDDGSFLQTNLQPADILERIDEQYGKSTYGKVKYSPNEMFWIGYIYRYFAYTYDYSSKKVYKLIKPGELRDVFLPYHTLDPAQAIERLLEAKHYSPEDQMSIERQFEIFKRVRQGLP